MNNTGQIVKAKISRDFTIVPNNIAQNKQLNLEEKGLLIYLLSLPNDWVLYKGNLHALTNEKEGTIDRVFKSLQTKGYILSMRQMNKDGRFTGWNHIVYETPTLNTEIEETPMSGFVDVGETTPIQIHNTNKKRNNNKESKVVVPPTIEDVVDFFNKEGYSESSARKAWNHYNDGDWFDSNGKKVMNWKSKMRNVWFREEHKQPVKDDIEKYRHLKYFKEYLHSVEGYTWRVDGDKIIYTPPR